jgi:pilus assembly protein CpaE
MTDETTTTAIRIFISGACAGLAEARDALASHPDIELVGTASEPSKAGAKLASTGAQVILHALQRPDHVPADEIAAIRDHTSAPIILLVTRSTPTLVDEAVQAGISDVLLLPQLADMLVFNVKKAHAMGAVAAAGRGGGVRSSDTCKVITLFSPKGGTGKTTLATNVGAHMAKVRHQRTLLIDLDLQFGDVAILLGTHPKTTILDLMMAHGDLDIDKVNGYVTHHESGLHVLPAPLRPEDAEMVTDDRLATLLTVARQAYDVVIIDTPPNFNSTVLTALDRTDELVIVASLDVSSVKSVKVCSQTLEMLHYPSERCHIVLNRAETKVGLKRDEVEKALARKIRWGVPSNRAVPTSINRGVPVVVSDPRSDVARAIAGIADQLLPERAAANGSVEAERGRAAAARRAGKRERGSLVGKLRARRGKGAGALGAGTEPLFDAEPFANPALAAIERSRMAPAGLPGEPTAPPTVATATDGSPLDLAAGRFGAGMDDAAEDAA